MRQGHIERLIYNFLEEPATEQLVCEVHAPQRKPDTTHYPARELHKIRLILSRMEKKNLIEKVDGVYRRKL